MGILSGKRPTGVGVRNGNLKAPPSSPNAVSSQASGDYHQIAPLTYRGTPEQALMAVRAIIENTQRAQLIEIKNDYLYAEYTSALLGFVDDVEFYFPRDAKIIHVRSASRLGSSDFGVNRRRIEDIRARLAQTGA